MFFALDAGFLIPFSVRSGYNNDLPSMWICSFINGIECAGDPDYMKNADIQLQQPSPAARRFFWPGAGMILIACICGWFMMQLEILGARILVPYFGSDIYVNTGSVIGVFLLSLSIGYILGGWLCSKFNAWMWLGIVMTLVGIWNYMIPLITDPICDPISYSDIDIKWGALLSSLIL